MSPASYITLSLSLTLSPSQSLVHSLFLSFFPARSFLTRFSHSRALLFYSRFSSPLSFSRFICPLIACLYHCLPSLLFYRLPHTHSRVSHARTHVRTRAQPVAGTCTIPSRDRLCFFPPPYAAPRYLPRLGAGDHRGAAIPSPSFE